MTYWNQNLTENGNQARIISIDDGMSTETYYSDKDVAFSYFETEKTNVYIMTYEDYTGYVVHHGGEEYPNDVKGINVLSVDLISYPTTIIASNITSTSFRANWYPMSNYTYLLDVATDVAFSNILVGYNNLAITNGDTFKNVTGLSPATDYYYRVRNKTWWNEVSGNSKFIKVTTLP